MLSSKQIPNFYDEETLKERLRIAQGLYFNLIEGICKEHFLEHKRFTTQELDSIYRASINNYDALYTTVSEMVAEEGFFIDEDDTSLEIYFNNTGEIKGYNK